MSRALEELMETSLSIAFRATLAVLLLALAARPLTETTQVTAAPATFESCGNSKVGRLFTGDYSTGNFLQWPHIANKFYNGATTGYAEQYSARVISEDKDCGYSARFETRTGDVPEFGGGERSEVFGTGVADANAGTTRWYAFSVKFDPTFPTNHHDLGWGITNQFHDSLGLASPTIAWGFSADPGFANGYWYLMHQPQSSPGVFLGNAPILAVPQELGVWFDIKMQVYWSPSDSDGYVRVWVNGVPQTLAGGSQTFRGRTMIPGTSAVNYQEGYYRANGIIPTGVVYHMGFRMGDSEDSL